MRGLLAVLFCQLVLCGPLLAAQQSEITGAVAYTEAVLFDYTKEGTRNKVQFWLEFKGSPAFGDPKDAGYKPESGAIHYYLVDMDNKKQVDNWLMGFSMMEEPPPSGPYPMTGIEIRGNQAMFTAFGMKWTVIDGGQGYAKDTVKIDDGFRTKGMKLYGGDLRVVNVRMEAHAHNQDCTTCYECHEGPAREMIVKGGKHNKMDCGDCHIGHPPEAEHSYTACMECHEPHSDQMAEDACGQCHRAHIATEVTYAFNVPSAYCAACHQDTSDGLAASQSKHSDIACALCHQEQHGASFTCQYCHGGTHPQHVMKKTDICAVCHHTAHDLESARTK
jgi:predicted CXXCH cytochrome family protein